MDAEYKAAYAAEEARRDQEASAAKMEREAELIRKHAGTTASRWEKDAIRQRLLESRHWVERAIVAIYNRQTADEKGTEQTRWQNGVGFNGPDAHYMSYLARWILSGRHLSGKHLERGRKRVLKYAGQLAEIANDNVKVS
jgi:hypothetical protein